MFQSFKSMFKPKGWSRDRSGVDMSAAAAIPPQPLPTKVSNKQLTLPSFLTTATPSPESPLVRKDRLLANKDITDYRTGADSRQVIRDFSRSDPNLSAAVTAYIRTGITTGYTAIARNLEFGRKSCDQKIALLSRQQPAKPPNP